MENTKRIGNKIAEARKKITISQAQLAQRLFISPQAVGKWERGESMPDITTFNRLAEILGVDLNYFSDGTVPVPAEMASAGFPVEQPVELPSGQQPENLRWDMSHGNWKDADFSGLKNLHEKFNASNMQRCKFLGSDLSELLLTGNNVDGCDFSGSDISNSHIKGSNLFGNIFTDCSLKGAEFSGSNIDRCDFSNVNFTGAKVSKSYIKGCDFKGADFTGVVFKSGGLEKNEIDGAMWKHTSFVDTRIADIVFAGTLEDCYFENCDFKKVTFRDATLINTFFKNNTNLKRIRFTDCKADRMTYEFLKQGKADLSGITLIN